MTNQTNNNQFRDEEIVIMTHWDKKEEKWVKSIYPKVGGRLRLAHEDNEQISISSSIIKFDGEIAVVMAVTTTMKGIFPGYGMASVERDKTISPAILELAETRAISRSLRFSGYGVEYCSAEEISHLENGNANPAGDNMGKAYPPTPTIEKRHEASLRAQKYGFEVRWRIDPIFPVDGWREIYGDFIRETSLGGHRPTRITLGTYREMNRNLLTFSRGGGLAALGWEPKRMVKEGSHYHLPKEIRIELYKTIKKQIEGFFTTGDKPPLVALCKETFDIRKAVGVEHGDCNCQG